MKKDQFSRKHRSAANALNAVCEGHPWFHFVGLGTQDRRPVLYLYVRKNCQIAKAMQSMDGFPIIVEKIGRVVPLVNRKRKASNA